MGFNIKLPEPIDHNALRDQILNGACNDRFAALMARNAMRRMAQTPVEERNMGWWHDYPPKALTVVRCEGKCKEAGHNHAYHPLDADPVHYYNSFKKDWEIIPGK